MAERRTFVLGDVHLTRHTAPAVAADLARFFAGAAGQRVIVAGDFFDLATDAPHEERRRAVSDVLGAHPELRGALGRFLDGGGELTLLGGNHDAAMGDTAAGAELRELIGARSDAALSAAPWFLRDAGLHVEHGHFYDPDNAPAHPLVDGAVSLGVHFSSEFIHATQAHRFLQANDGTPLNLFLSSFRWYGWGAPRVVLRYFQAAFAALAKAGPFYRAASERGSGEERHARFAEAAGVPTAVVDAVLAAGAAPTLESWSATFARLYMDRVIATVAITGGAGALGIGALRGAPRVAAWGAGSVVLGSMLMATSWLHAHDRYRGTVVERLASAAERIGTTGAELVVFGHTHREACGDGYANTGSFAWPREAPGRPYLEIVREPRPRAVRHYLAPGS
jgi:hypothetical protein